jgi:WD40 repeat protein
MDLGSLAAITIVDVYVVSALAAFSLALWVARRYIGWLLKLVPGAIAVLGTLITYGAWQLGESVSWDTPGSPGILIVYFALGGGMACAVAGWIAFSIQLRRWCRRGMRPSSPLPGDDQRVRIALVIALIVGSLFSAYRYYRSHQSSHQADIARLEYSPNGAFLYSLDTGGTLKKWNVRYQYEARRWRLPGADGVSTLLPSGDGKTLVALRGNEVKSWTLTDSLEASQSSTLPDIVAAAPVDGIRFVAVSPHDVSLRAYADVSRVDRSSSLTGAALSASPCGDRKVVVGTDDSKLHFYAVTSGLDELVTPPMPPLDVTPRQIRADRTCTHIVAADGDKKMVVIDLQNARRDAVAQYWLPAKFEVSNAGELLLGQVGITGYEIATRATEPIFNHGGAIAALAISPRGDDFAIANRREIWLRTDSRHYAAPEVWLNGRAELPSPLRVAVASIFGDAALPAY